MVSLLLSQGLSGFLIGEYVDIDYKSMTIKILHTEDELKKFWTMMDEYMARDIFPYSSIGRVLSQEDKEWFSSTEYRTALYALSKRDVDTFFFAFLMMKEEVVGFVYYGTYLSEDGKCFISEYCILPEYRNKGLGKEYFMIIKESEIRRGAKYFELNVSNERNKEYWEKIGFKFDGYDEHHVMLMKLSV